MANTPNIDLEKLAGSSKLKDFPSMFNSDMDKIDSAVGGLNNKIMKPTHLGNVETYTAAGALILTAIGGMADSETRNFMFGAIQAQIYWTSGTLFSGFVTRYNSGIFAGLFTNQIGETISISTHDGGTTYLYSSSSVKNVDLTSLFSSYSYLQYTHCNIARCGKIAIFSFAAYVDSTYDGSGIVIENAIPEGYIPNLASAYGPLIARITTNATGTIYIEGNTGTLAIDSLVGGDKWVGATITYVIW